MNKVGKYARGESINEIELLKMVLELTEKEKMRMWAYGYIDDVIDKLPDYGKDILEKRRDVWEEEKEYVRQTVEGFLTNRELQVKAQGERKKLALFIMKNFSEYKSLLFTYIDKNAISDEDIRKFIYRKRYPVKKKHLYLNAVQE
ncbi:hypothetical protein [Bacillus sp. FJAT-45350]|uniref:hypothetical protein n=1 Tax=Bacillus sp. FJAT-45350 TaxID=2011014 RepID=UPI000BB8CD51|nr:hypothetical protein [Bacillus sp. FJAT-45350]